MFGRTYIYVNVYEPRQMNCWGFKRAVGSALEIEINSIEVGCFVIRILTYLEQSFTVYKGFRKRIIHITHTVFFGIEHGYGNR